MLLANFIKSLGKNWREVLSSDPYNLTIKEEDDLIILKYNQIKSDFSKEIVRRARGLILDYNFNYVCRPFDKFFNYGESYAEDIDWNSHSLSVTEKIDGSLIKLFYYKGWRIATNGNINAFNSPLFSIKYDNFGDLFLEALNKYGATFDDLTYSLNKDFTYMFELVSPYTKVVIPYEEIDLYYLGARDNFSGAYMEEDRKVLSFIKRPKTYKINSLEKVIHAAAQLDWQNEGFVVFDGENRIKVKSPAYVMAHHARNNGVITVKHLTTIALSNEGEEFLAYASEYKEEYNKIKQALEELKEKADFVVECCSAKKYTNRARFAKWVEQEIEEPIIKSYIYKWYGNKEVTWDEYIQNCSIKSIVVAIERKLKW